MSEWKSQLQEAVSAGKVLASSFENIEALLAGVASDLPERVVAELVEGEHWSVAVLLGAW